MSCVGILICRNLVSSPDRLKLPVQQYAQPQAAYGGYPGYGAAADPYGQQAAGGYGGGYGGAAAAGGGGTSQWQVRTCETLFCNTACIRLCLQKRCLVSHASELQMILYIRQYAG